MKMKGSLRYRIFTVFNYITLVIMAFVMVFPYVNVLAKSFNEGNDTAKGGIVFLPRIWTLENYKIILEDISYIRSVGLTIVIILCSTILGLTIQFSAAYALSKKTFPFKKSITMLFVIPMYFGAGMIPVYVLYSKLGLLNNFWVHVLPGLFSYYNTVIMRTFIQSTIPDSLYESAYLDGANDVDALCRITLPLCKPVLATVTLWLVVGEWNNSTTTLYYITSPKLQTVSYKMMQVVKEAERIEKLLREAAEQGIELGYVPQVTGDAVVCTQIILTTIPIVMVYPFLSKYFVKGVMLGAVKG